MFLKLQATVLALFVVAAMFAATFWFIDTSSTSIESKMWKNDVHITHSNPGVSQGGCAAGEGIHLCR